MFLLFTIANLGQHHSHKKIFLGISKNSFRWASIIFSETPESCGQKDLSRIIQVFG